MLLKKCGVIEGILVMVIVSIFSIEAMLLLVKCKYKILNVRLVKKENCNPEEYKNSNSTEESKTFLNDICVDDMKFSRTEKYKDISYGDVGFYALGPCGKWLVDGALLVSQLGFCCAYLIFILETLSSYISISKSIWLLFLLPGLFLLTMIRNLNKLSIFSFCAQMSNVVGLAVVFWFDFDHMYSVDHRFHLKEFSIKSTPFFFAVAIYCFEGAGMILSLEESLIEKFKPNFKKYFVGTISVLTLLYIAFGVSGYMSFGPDTKAIITLNLPHGNGIDFAMIVKICLCTSLFFSYPVMMFPVTKLLEPLCLPETVQQVMPENILRLLLVSITGLIVIAVPNFANLMAFIGSTCCTLLAFILPGLFHIMLFKDTINSYWWIFDGWLIFFGLSGAVLGTADVVNRMLSLPQTLNRSSPTPYHVNISEHL